MAGSCSPMVGGGNSKNETLVSPSELWPPPNSAVGNDKSASQLLYLTVEYVEGNSAMHSNPSLFDPSVSESLPEFQPRVTSPLGTNLDSIARYSPVPSLPKSTGSTLTEPIYSDSFSAHSVSNSIDVFNAPIPSVEASSEQNAQVIVMDSYYPQRETQLASIEAPSVEDFSNPEYILPESSEKLLLECSSLQSSELLISVEDAAVMFSGNKPNGRIEFLLSNGNIAYSLVDSVPPRILQIPKEYLVNLGRLNLDEPNVETDSEIFSGKTSDPKWNQASLDGLQNTPFSVDTQGDLLNNSLLEESASILHENSLSNVLPRNIDVSNEMEKKKTFEHHISSSDPIKETSSFWCDDCNCFYETECNEHQFQTISDKPVLSRARATLPAPYLAINEVKSFSRAVKSEFGVFARKAIPKRTQFGPVEGVYVEYKGIKSTSESHPRLLVEDKPNEFVEIDVSNEQLSNWMRFVRPADSTQNQNLWLSQQGKALYFITSKTILPKEELRVWYSSVYASKRKLPILKLDDNLQSSRKSLEVDRAGSDEDNIDNELEVDENNRDAFSKNNKIKDEKTKSIQRLPFHWKKNTSKKIVSLEQSKTEILNCQKSDFECNLCEQRFVRYSSLQRHLLIHSGLEKCYSINVLNKDKESPPERKSDLEGSDANKENTSSETVPKKERIWHCLTCGLIFPDDSLYKLHVVIHSKLKEEEESSDEHLMSCPECQMKFSSNQQLGEHVGVHSIPWTSSAASVYSCTRCNKLLANADRWRQHENRHKLEDAKPFECTICFRRFLSSSALICHMNYHGSNKMFECPICKIKFSKVLSLKSHIHDHCTNGVYKCPHCPKECERYNYIRKHIRSFHSERKHACHVCGKLFPAQDKLRIHLLKHSDRREFLCATCGKQFKRKDKLKAHVDRIHSVEREKMKAEQTAVQSKKKSNVIKKLMPKLLMNSSDYSRYIYKCHSCLVGFKRRGMLVNHLANRHPEIAPDTVPELNLPILKTRRDYYCQYCDKIYKSSSKRKAHILKNHPGSALPLSNRLKGNSLDVNQLPNASYSQTVESVTSNPHSCQWCHRQYASKAKLLQHQRKKHKELVASNISVTPSAKPIKQKRIKNKTLRDVPAVPDPSIPDPPTNDLPRDSIPVMSGNFGITTTEIEFRECQQTGNIFTVKREIKDGLTVDMLNQALTSLGPSLSELVTYVTNSDGQQTCTLNLTQEQYMKIIEQTSPSSLNCISMSTIPVNLNSHARTTTGETAPIETSIAQAIFNSYPFTNTQQVHTAPFTAR